MLIDDLDIRVIDTTTGEVLRHLTLDPARGYNPATNDQRSNLTRGFERCRCLATYIATSHRIRTCAHGSGAGRAILTTALVPARLPYIVSSSSRRSSRGRLERSRSEGRRRAGAELP